MQQDVVMSALKVLQELLPSFVTAAGICLSSESLPHTVFVKSILVQSFIDHYILS